MFHAEQRSTRRARKETACSASSASPLETPEGNLVRGMQWLEATFANRFNRYRGEHGHLFQGRYKSLLVEAGGALGQVCH